MDHPSRGILNVLPTTRSHPSVRLQDISDRLSHVFSCGILLAAAGISMVNVYFRRAVICLMPTEATSSLQNFGDAICWAKDSYTGINLGLNGSVADQEFTMQLTSSTETYQWVPFYLLFQALLFFLPYAVWRSLVVQKLGEGVNSILNKTRGAGMVDTLEERQTLINTASNELFRMSRHNKENRHRLKCVSSRIPGTSMFTPGDRLAHQILYSTLLVKFLYLINAIQQLIFIRSFLGSNEGIFTFTRRLIRMMKMEDAFLATTFLPRQISCEFEITQFSGSHLYKVDCAVPVNRLNEKMYISLWLWIAFVAILTNVSLIRKLLRAIVAGIFQRRTILRNLIDSLRSHCSGQHQIHCSACGVDGSDPRLKDFIEEHVRSDGVFLLNMIREDTGEVLYHDILTSWWHIFIQSETGEEAVAVEKKRPRELK